MSNKVDIKAPASVEAVPNAWEGVESTVAAVTKEMASGSGDRSTVEHSDDEDDSDSDDDFPVFNGGQTRARLRATVAAGNQKDVEKKKEEEKRKREEEERKRKEEEERKKAAKNKK